MSARIAVCLIEDHKGDLLMGKRNDNHKWTFAGGHAEHGEDPYAAAIRELKEEAGLDAITVKMLTVEKVGVNIIYVFKVSVDTAQEIDTSGDPDKEFNNLEYIDPNTVVDNLHVPVKKNVALKCWMNS